MSVNKSRAISPSTTEEIHFNDAEGKDGFVLRPEATQLRIYSSPETEMNDSSLFTCNRLVDYAWDLHYTFGRLVATHLQSKFIAYVVKVNNAGAVRVLDMDTKERLLMKGDKGLIKDIDFMHKQDDITIGYIDEYGTFYVNKVIKEMNTGKLTCHPIIKVSMDGAMARLENRRFIWCKYVPDETNSSTDCAYHFAVLQNEIIHAGNLAQITQSQGEGSHHFNEIREEFLTIDTHSAAVTDASFAPDGTALATASKDGTVKFFQIYFQEKSPARCLYSWAPHDGRPVDKIFFLDNHTMRDTPTESQYWKFMITASDNMTELKLFTCKSWECLQTLKFCGSDSEPAQWKVEIDMTAKYLLATDIRKKTLYMLHLDHEESARFHWIREFSMPWSIISFNISSAVALSPKLLQERGFAQSIVGDQSVHEFGEDVHFLDLNIVQPRSLQNGLVAVKAPEFYCRANSHPRISFKNDISYQDLKDKGNDDLDYETENLDKRQLELAPSKSHMKVSSPPSSRSASSEKERPSPVNMSSTRRSATVFSPQQAGTNDVPSVAQMSEQLSSLIGVGGGRTSSRSSVSAGRGKSSSPHRMAASVILDDFGQTNGNNRNSASSSPSREVEEILSPKNNEQSRASITGMEDTVILNTLSSAFENGNLPSSLRAKLDKSPNLKMYSGTEMSPQIPQVLDQVKSLMDMMSLQSLEILDLKKEVSRLTNVQGAALKAREDAPGVSHIIDKQFKQNNQQLNRLEDALRNMEKGEQQRAAQLQGLIPKNLDEGLAARIGNIVKQEVQTVVPQAVGLIFEPSRLNIDTQIERLTSIVEAKLTQNISHILQRDKIFQTLTSNFQTITKEVFESAFEGVFKTSVYPKCEEAAQEMLRQTRDVFYKGTQEYLVGLEDVFEKERKRDDLQELIRDQMNGMQDALTSTLQVEVESQMLRALGGLQSGVVRQIEESMNRELARAFRDQQRYFEISVIPRTATPAVSVSDNIGGQLNPTDPVAVQRNLLAMAKNGDVFNAFVQASNHGDVNVLLHLCKHFNPNEVFDAKLPTHVHVSIMHLLALDILEESEIKISYLSAGVTSLDTSDRKTVKSVARMIPVFQAAVTKFRETNPDSKLLRPIKILEMAFQGTCSMQMKSPSTPGSSQSFSQHSFSQYQ